MNDVVEDTELEVVHSYLTAMDPAGDRIAKTLRITLDQLYDGQHTGRYRWDQLFKTEKTHCGTLVEINLQREFGFEDGDKLDYSIMGHDVDCKYSQSNGGWMIPNEALGKLCLVVTADDAKATWSAGVIRARPEWLTKGGNRDGKVQLSAFGRRNVRWLGFPEMPLPKNLLLHLPQEDLAAIFSSGSGQQRVNELFRRVTGVPIWRGVVATVGRQADYMKRIRYDGGARSALRPEGIVIFGHKSAHQMISTRLGLPALASGESLSARIAKAAPGSAWAAQIDGAWWRLATESDPVVVAPLLPRVSGAS